jgi:hypothetical protein
MERLVMRIEPTADYPHGTRLPTDDEILQHPAVVEALARAREEERRLVVKWLNEEAERDYGARMFEAWASLDDASIAIRSGVHLPQPAPEDPS